MVEKKRLEEGTEKKGTKPPPARPRPSNAPVPQKPAQEQATTNHG